MTYLKWMGAFILFLLFPLPGTFAMSSAPSKGQASGIQPIQQKGSLLQIAYKTGMPEFQNSESSLFPEQMYATHQALMAPNDGILFLVAIQIAWILVEGACAVVNAIALGTGSGQMAWGVTGSILAGLGLILSFGPGDSETRQFNLLMLVVHIPLIGLSIANILSAPSTGTHPQSLQTLGSRGQSLLSLRGSF